MSSDAHICLGAVAAFQDQDWAGAGTHFRKAIDRDPYCAAGHVWLALASLVPAGDLAGAERELAQAHQLAPSPFQDEADVLFLYFSGRYQEILNRAPNPAQLPDLQAWSRGCALAGLGRVPEAIETLEHSTERSRRVLAMLGYLYGVVGRTGQAREALAECAARRERGEWIGNYELALIHAGLSQAEPVHRNEALASLLRASREKEPWMAFLPFDPRLQTLRSMPDFIGLTELPEFMPDERNRSTVHA
jgi:tetratricopeptide (TPR) repeat protein